MNQSKRLDRLEQRQPNQGGRWIQPLSELYGETGTARWLPAGERATLNDFYLFEASHERTTA